VADIDINAWCEGIITGVGGLDDYNRYERAGLDTQLDAVKWAIRCLANPKCAGSAEVLAAIIERRQSREQTGG